MQPNISIIILAAGSSTRFGTPKQLLPYKGKSLLRYICETALQSKGNSVYVVLGSQISLMKKELAGLNLNIIENPNWQKGISSSIQAGIKALSDSFNAAIFLLCDQPKVTSALIDSMIDAYLNSQHPIVACKYGDTVGVPALFQRNIFPELLLLKGDKGAKQILTKHTSDKLLIDFPDGIYDIDSPNDTQSIK